MKIIYAESCNCESNKTINITDKTPSNITAPGIFLNLRDRSFITKGLKEKYFSVHYNNKHILNIIEE